MVKIIQNVQVLNAITIGKSYTSVSDALTKEYIKKRIPQVGGSFYYGWYYKESPTLTYFIVKNVSGPIFSVYFIVGGNSNQYGAYHIDLSNGAIERNYDNLSRGAGF